jgi:uncharacterized membrane-anchored protein
VAAALTRHRASRCPDLETIASYLDRRLAAVEQARVAEHIAACDTCHFVFIESVQTHVSAGIEMERRSTPAMRTRRKWPLRSLLMRLTTKIRGDRTNP